MGLDEFYNILFKKYCIIMYLSSFTLILILIGFISLFINGEKSSPIILSDRLRRRLLTSKTNIDLIIL